ncbi:MAG: ABC-type transport auxiliary lipoprotein family protein [Pseudomonadota bacterium]
MGAGKMAARALVLVLILAAAAGCSALSPKPAVLVEQYTLEYPPPAAAGLKPLATAILVERFNLARQYDGQGMVFRPEAFRRQVYNYHRWRANPADLVADYLVRDLQASGLFSGVFTNLKPGLARFTLQGGVREFLELDQDGGSLAVVEVELSLMDNDQRGLPQRLVFQRSFRHEAAMKEASAPELARAMSQAMARLSAQVLGALHQALAARLAEVPAGAVTK